jgi:hypothetical protein
MSPFPFRADVRTWPDVDVAGLTGWACALLVLVLAAGVLAGCASRQPHQRRALDRPGGSGPAWPVHRPWTARLPRPVRTRRAARATWPAAFGDVEPVIAVADEAEAWIGDQVVLSQRRCVDVLLDLYCVSEDPVVRLYVTARLREIRLLHGVRAEDMRAALAAIVDVSTVQHLGALCA